LIQSDAPFLNLVKRGMGPIAGALRGA
jgi:hypothetical protein